MVALLMCKKSYPAASRLVLLLTWLGCFALMLNVPLPSRASAFVQLQPRLTKPTPSPSGQDGAFGTSVAFDETGSLAAVGAALYNGYRGAIFLYTRSGGRWILSNTVATGGSFDSLGFNVRLTSNVMISSSDDTDFWIFKRVGVAWTLVQPKITFSHNIHETALSSDGTIISVVDLNYLYVYTKQGDGTYALLGGPFQPSSFDEYPTNIGLSSNGTILAVSGSRAAFSFRSGGAWIFRISIETSSVTEVQTISAPTGSPVGLAFGTGVCISGNGNVLAVGSVNQIFVYQFDGSAYIPAETWLPASATSSFASYVKPATDYFGNIIAVGDMAYPTGKATIYIFNRTESPAGGSTPAKNQLVPYDASSGWYYDIALTPTGTQVACGNFAGSNQAGEAYIFEYQAKSQSPTQLPTSSPIIKPTGGPSRTPSRTPSTAKPSRTPSLQPTTSVPSQGPSTSRPSLGPSRAPSTSRPSISPVTSRPSMSPTTARPSFVPVTSRPSSAPSTIPTTSSPSQNPSVSPSTSQPSASPVTAIPTPSPSLTPSTAPTQIPSNQPTKRPSSLSPTAEIAAGTSTELIIGASIGGVLALAAIAGVMGVLLRRPTNTLNKGASQALGHLPAGPMNSEGQVSSNPIYQVDPRTLEFSHERSVV